MKAEQMISRASYGPEALKTICQAFDQAWAQIAHQFGDDQFVVEAARVRLAEAILEITHEDNIRDIEALIHTGLRRMALGSL